MRIRTKKHITDHAKQVMGWKQHWQAIVRNGDKHDTDGWYEHQPEEGTPEAAAKARRMTPGQNEGASNCGGTGSTNAHTQNIKQQYNTTQKPKKVVKIKEEAANSIGAGTIPSTTENPEGSKKRRNWHPLTKHYIDIGGRRRKLVR